MLDEENPPEEGAAAYKSDYIIRKEKNKGKSYFTLKVSIQSIMKEEFRKDEDFRDWFEFATVEASQIIHLASKLINFILLE